MVLNLNTISFIENSEDKEKIHNFLSPLYENIKADKKEKFFNEFCFFLEIKSKHRFPEDLFIYFGYSDNGVNNSYEFDILFFLEPKPKSKKRKKIVCNIEFHNAIFEANFDEKTMNYLYEKKKENAIKYFSDLLNIDSKNHYLDFIFYFKLSNNKNVCKRETISLQNKTKLKKYISYSSYITKKNIENYLLVLQKKAINIEKLLIAVNGEREKIVDEILKETLSSDNDAICIKGSAGSGKTVLAFQLRNDLIKRGKNVLFQIVNINFFKLLENKLGTLKNIECLTRNIKYLLESNNFDVLIVDEAQRIDDKVIEYCLNKKIKLVLLGDDKQRIYPNKDLFSIEDFSKRKDIKIFSKTIEKHRRFKKKNMKWLNYIYCSPNKPNERFDKNFEILNFTNEKDFLEYFDSLNKNSKCFTTIQHQKLSKKPFSKPSAPKGLKDECYFLEKSDLYENYIFSPYNIISLETDANFIFLPKEFTISSEGSKIKISYSLGLPHHISFYKNQFWVLLTRATQKIIFYAADEKTSEYLEKKCSEYNNLK